MNYQILLYSPIQICGANMPTIEASSLTVFQKGDMVHFFCPELLLVVSKLIALSPSSLSSSSQSFRAFLTAKAIDFPDQLVSFGTASNFSVPLYNTSTGSLLHLLRHAVLSGSSFPSLRITILT